MSLRDELQALLRERDVVADDISESFAKDLERIFRELFDELRTSGVGQQMDIEEIQNIRALLRAAGYDDLVDRLSVESAHMLDVMQERLRATGLPAEFVTPNPDQVAALIDIDHADMEFYGLEISHKIEQSLRRSVLAGQTIEEATDSIETALTAASLNPSNAYTLANTSLLDLNQRAQNMAAETGGAEWWVYLGPDDDATRPFCQALIDTRFSRDMIGALDNQQIPDAFVSRGGWNCRHQFLAIFEDQLDEFPIGDVDAANAAASERRSAA